MGNSIFDRVSEIREALGFHYPDLAVILPEEMDDEEIPSIMRSEQPPVDEKSVKPLASSSEPGVEKISISLDDIDPSANDDDLSDGADEEPVNFEEGIDDEDDPEEQLESFSTLADELDMEEKSD